jgi:T5orf172 domain
VIADGFLYFLVSPAYPGWIKVGQTSDYEKRLATYQTASPHADYNMIHVSYVKDRVLAEQEMFVALDHLPRKGEWFEVGDLDINNFGWAGYE